MQRVLNKQMGFLIGILITSLVILSLLSFFVKQSERRAVQTTPSPSTAPQRLFTSLTAVASKSEVGTGETFTISVMIETRENLATGVQLELVYDPKTIAITAVTTGDFFDKPIEYANKNDAKTGQITYAIGSFAEKKGAGTVATITARALKKTNGAVEVLTIAPTSIVTELNNQNTVLKDTKGATLVIR